MTNNPVNMHSSAYYLDGICTMGVHTLVSTANMQKYVFLILIWMYIKVLSKILRALTVQVVIKLRDTNS